jgi:two-component system, chemotaxis family, CheB/CheR fusion protein
VSDAEAPATASGEASPQKHLVVVGASAGGVEALSVLVGGLPNDFPAPVVIAQHLDPTRPSFLHTILQRRTTLAVHLVEESTKMQAGTVYVVPSNRHVAIDDGHVSLETEPRDRPLPSVDLLLTTAARSYGEQLIAVILTGSGSDGAAGAVDVKEAGGTVIIQNPLTARHSSMPSALPPTAVDHVADLENIPGLLDSLARATAIAEAHPRAADVLQDILGEVTRTANVDFRAYKTASLARRLARRMAVTRHLSLEEYARHVQTHPGEVSELVRTLLIKVTEFFRDPEAFTFLRESVLPEVIKRGRERGRRLRLWSAGCATGEEAFSLVLAVADLLGHEIPEWDVKVFATDLDEQAVAFARRGLYSANLMRHVPPEYMARYFETTPDGVRVIKPLRQMVIFGQQDLGRGVPFPRIDLVSCRNLLIYFQPQLQQEVLDLFAYSLHQTKGFLFLGKAETARPSKATFELVNKKWKVYRCLEGPAAARVIAAPAPGTGDKALRAPAERSAAEPALSLTDAEMGTARRFTELMLRHMPVGAVVIDRAYRTLSANGAARRLLQIRDQRSDVDFLHSVQGIPYTEARAAIDAVFRDHAPVTLPEVRLAPMVGGEPRFVTFTVSLMAEASVGEVALLTVVDATEAVQTKNSLLASEQEHKATLEALGAANRRLNDSNKDLGDANEQLQAANEELMLAQEELQATNEEFEATNEELQATNEELETNNEELQATNEELETTNEELTARTSELQEMTGQLASDRARLAEMVELAPFHVLLLRGPSLLIEAFSPSLGRFLKFDNSLERPLAEVLPDARALLDAVRTAYEKDTIWASPPEGLHFPGPQGPETYRFTVVPRHRHQHGVVDGVVVYAEPTSPLPRN